jgi:hypothetical protein
MIFLPVTPRARRMAVMVASVPELTIRTISIAGKAATILRAMAICPRSGP